jgi:ribonuclease-3
MIELPSFVGEALGGEPKDPKLFERAMTHGSHGRETYERLEFLGDRVLGRTSLKER